MSDSMHGVQYNKGLLKSPISVMVYLSLDQRNGSNGFLESFDLSSRTSDQRCARVHNGLTATLTKGQLTADSHTGKHHGFTFVSQLLISVAHM